MGTKTTFLQGVKMRMRVRMRQPRKKSPGKISKFVSEVSSTAFDFASQSLMLLAAVTSAASTVCYVMYKDFIRYRRMVDTFATGNMIEPYRHSDHEVQYFSRPEDEEHVQEIIRSEVSNQYYYIFGEVGVGKTRLVTTVVRQAIEKYGKSKLGAPVYVLTTQGSSFADSFANAVHYSFDEHINFKSFLDIVLRIGEVPKLDEQSKLDRVLNAIETAAYWYLQKTNQPAVIVIDGVDCISETSPQSLARLQEKAKLWADTNIAKVLFVSNTEKTEMIFQKNDSAWSRGAMTFFIEDLSKEQAKEFLRLKDEVLAKCARSSQLNAESDMPEEWMEQIIDLVGGRLQLLLVCKQAWLAGKTFKETSSHLKLKERVKFRDIADDEMMDKIINTLREAPGRKVYLSKLDMLTSREVVNKLATMNIIKIVQDEDSRFVVQFQSRLTENVIDDLAEHRAANLKDTGLKN